MTAPVIDHERPEGTSDGFIVPTALWILAALAALAVIVSVYLVQSTRSVAALDSALQSDLLTSAGVELAAYQILSTSNTAIRPTRGRITFPLAQTDVTVEYVSEAARINLNMASKAMLTGLFSALGADAEAANSYAERVAGWRSSAKPNGLDTEEGLYAAAGTGYLPRRSAFQSTDELWLVLGLPPGIVERMLPFVTVYSGLADVNVLDAAPTVIAALPDMTPAKLSAFLGQRDSLQRDPQSVIDALGGHQVGATVNGSDAYRIRIRFALPNRRLKMSEVVIQSSLGENETGAFRILSWQDDL